VVDAFEGDIVVDTGEDVTDEAYVAMLDSIPALAAPVKALLSEEDPADAESPAMLASAVEMVLEGLHLSKRLNKDGAGSKAQFRSRS
jgi:magnesium chelatase subunit I